MATFTVTTNQDVIDANDGVLSLREAIIEANSNIDEDTIELAAGETYNLTLAGSDNDAAVGDLDIRSNLTILGNGATIDAGGLGDRVVQIVDPDLAVTLTLPPLNN